ncbi:MAG: PEP-CTERM sorting domain-containing protein [Verrucomicrobiota bacterium]|nr:PEP-CTERM sorting domain-containing protein [Verrucomicrobiota bacterium]
MKKWIIGIGIMVVFSAQAVVVDFTAAEGYSGTGTVQLWGDSLHAQTPTVGDWTESSWGSFAVDSSAGTVALDGTVAYKSAVFNQGLASSEVYTIGAGFSFTRVENAILSANQELLALDFTEVADTSGNRIAMQIRRPSWNSAKYQLSFYENTGGANTSGTGTAADETDLGFGVGDDQSDDLWLGMTLTRGADASSWTASGVIINLTTGTEVATYDAGTFDTSSAFFTDDLYGRMGSVKADADTQVSNRVIDTFEVTSIPEPATLGLIATVSAGLLFIRRFMI